MISIKIAEKQKDGVKFILKKNNSKNLLIIFSGIGGDYNYKRSLKNSSYDQLFIKDIWANGVSYYLYEDGFNKPELLVSNFIDSFLKNHHYSKVVTLGSSKGGAAAIYFGIKHKVDEIYSGACQYRVGNYLGIYHEKEGHDYFQRVMGNTPLNNGIEKLNAVFDDIIKKNKNSKTIINLIYSIREHTFTDDIVFLIRMLDECNIKHIDQIETFPEHSMIGQYMQEICKNQFK